MSSAQPKADPPRPQEVTIGGLLAISGGVIAVVSLLMSMNNLYSVEMTEVLRDVMEGPGLRAWSLTIDDMRRLAKIIIMLLAVMAVTSAVLGVYVLRRDRIARIVLTAMGAVVVLLAAFSGVAGVVLAVYIAMSIGLLWSRAARTWFQPESTQSGPPFSGGPPVPGPPQQGPPQQGPPPGWRPPPPPPGWRPPPPPPGWRPPPPPPGWRPPPQGWHPPPGWRPPPTDQPPPIEQPPSGDDQGDGTSRPG